MTKKAQLIGQKAYAKEHGLCSSSVVLPTVYGPGDNFHENSHVMSALIGKFVGGAREGAASVEVWGSGLQEREFLFVEDAADGIIEASLAAKSPILNLGNGRSNSIREIAEIVAECAGFTGKIDYNENRFQGVTKRVMDVSRVEAELNWTAKTDIRDGIRKTVEWYERQLDGPSLNQPGD